MEFSIESFDFNKNIFSEIDHIHQVKDLWPIVYIINDGKIKQAYVGETTDTYSRLSSHLGHPEKKKLSSVYLIRSEKFNKSATLDIESNLIRYMAGDGEYQLLNANLGIAHHNYFQKKELYWAMFSDIWNELRSSGLVKHSLDHITNSDLFKYSPYKSLTSDQKLSLLEILNCIAQGKEKRLVIQGGAGTGKTILAVYLFKLLHSDPGEFNYVEFGENDHKFAELISEIKLLYPELKMGLVVPMASFRKTLQRVFKNIKGLKPKMVIGPAEVSENKFDILMVDESHRLRRRVNLGAYYGAFDKASEKLGMDKMTCNELDWVIQQSNHSILFYDADQSIKPSDVKKEYFDSLLNRPETKKLILKSQLRVKGGYDYVDFTDKLLRCELEKRDRFNSPQYECLLFESLNEMIDEIGKREKEHQLSRLIAGYSWEWISKEDKSKFDIQIGDVKLRWNSVNIDWVNSDEAINEVGCIHTTQGYDLNYAGIIFGNEIIYNPETNKIEIKQENYFDRNGKQSIKNPDELHSFIINIYKTILLRAIRGTYIYVCNPDLRAYFKNHITVFANKNSDLHVVRIINEPTEAAIPLYSMKVAAGEFGIQQNVDLAKWVELPKDIKFSKDLFACQVIGQSMNKIIPDGSICLFRKYAGGSRNGLVVLVECGNIQDFESGSSYTVKQFESTKDRISEDTWKHERIVLKPLSDDPNFSAIILEEDDLISFKTIGVFERVLGEI